jgi:hypothetical protein
MLMLGLCLQEPPPNQMNMNKQPVEFDQAINYVNKIKVRQQLQQHWSSSNAIAAAVAMARRWATARAATAGTAAALTSSSSYSHTSSSRTQQLRQLAAAVVASNSRSSWHERPAGND